MLEDHRRIQWGATILQGIVQIIAGLCFAFALVYGIQARVTILEDSVMQIKAGVVIMNSKIDCLTFPQFCTLYPYAERRTIK